MIQPEDLERGRVQGEGGREREALGQEEREQGGGRWSTGKGGERRTRLGAGDCGATVEPGLGGQMGQWEEQVTGEGKEEGMKSESAAQTCRSSVEPSFVLTHRLRERGHWAGHLRATRLLLRSGDWVLNPGNRVTSESPDSKAQPTVFGFSILPSVEKSKTRKTSSFQCFVGLFLT